MGEALRMSIHGHPLCATTSHLWGGSDAQLVVYSVTLLRNIAHEWYMGYERRHRQSPRDWAQLASVMLEQFGSNIRLQEAQSQLMSISQGQRPMSEYASQFESLLGRLDGYDKTMMLNQFVWGLQPELARSLSLHYPKSIAQAVSLVETTELAVKASRRLAVKGANPNKGQISQKLEPRFMERRSWIQWRISWWQLWWIWWITAWKAKWGTELQWTWSWVQKF